MAKQRLDTSLDAFDALIADLAAAGEVAGSELVALRGQAEVPHTSEIPVQAEEPVRAESRWAVTRPVVAPARTPVPAPAPASGDVQAPTQAMGVTPAATPAPSATAASTSPDAGARPLTRREARALREAEEAASVESVVAAHNARRTEQLIHSHRVRPAEPRLAPAPVLAPAATPISAKRRGSTRSLLAGVGAFALIPSLWFVAPAVAGDSQDQTTLDSHGRTAQQILEIGQNVQSPTMSNTNYIATALAAVVSEVGGTDAASDASIISAALQMGGPRQQIIETALAYLGTPYVLGGASHKGIDCSGLTMVAYAAAGVQLTHLVSAQDAVGTRITQDEAQPGDLVVFNDHAHIGIYLGDNQVLAAPAPGRKVSIESVDLWRGVGIHFTRVLPIGE